VLQRRLRAAVVKQHMSHALAAVVNVIVLQDRNLKLLKLTKMMISTQFQQSLARI
jgi:hypothetical protein